MHNEHTDLIYNQQLPDTKNDNGDCEKIWKITIEIKTPTKNSLKFLLKVLFSWCQDQ